MCKMAASQKAIKHVYVLKLAMFEFRHGVLTWKSTRPSVKYIVYLSYLCWFTVFCGFSSNKKLWLWQGLLNKQDYDIYKC